jgi:hypothetical protein
MVRVGCLGLAASLFPDLPRRQAQAGAPKRMARSVILLWMAGGVTHIDSFDPKPEAPEEIRGTLQAIDTVVPGIQFSEALPCLARAARHLTVVRSYSHDSDDHFFSQVYALSGRKVTTMEQLTSEPNIGSIVARLQGGRDGFPGYIAVPGTTRPGPPPKNLFTGGWLGMQYAPFSSGGAPRNEDFLAQASEAPEDEFNQQVLQLPPDVDGPRLAGRRSLLERLDDGLRRMEKPRGEDGFAQQFRTAYAMFTAPAVRQAFDLRLEPDAVRDRYGRTKIGQRCLLARRLVEAGARFVMVDYGYDPDYGNLWDNHRVPEQKQPHISEMVKLPHHLAGTDKATAALVEDLFARGMLEETLVVFLTEFGRTPKINPRGGRDHGGKAGSIFFAGGGARGGQVIGATDKHAAHCTTRGYSPGDVAATLYQAIGIDPNIMLCDRQNRPLPVLPQGRPIPGVL